MKPIEGLYIISLNRNDNKYRQSVSIFITNNQTLIDHIYTNLPESQAKSYILETFL
jgi:hypothetical protein